MPPNFYQFISSAPKGFLNLVILLCSLQQLHCQTIPLGNFFVKNFPQSSYKSDNDNFSPQNWAFFQDSRGIIYVGNTSGVLQFDGNQWKMVGGTDGMFPSGFAKDNQGRIYTGGYGELGYLDYDDEGRILFKSILETLDEKDRNFNRISRLISNENEILFKKIWPSM